MRKANSGPVIQPRRSSLTTIVTLTIITTTTIAIMWDNPILIPQLISIALLHLLHPLILCRYLWILTVPEDLKEPIYSVTPCYKYGRPGIGGLNALRIILGQCKSKQKKKRRRIFHRLIRNEHTSDTSLKFGFLESFSCTFQLKKYKIFPTLMEPN